MVVLKDSQIKISKLEKVLVNFAIPTDFIYHTLKSKIVNNQYSNQTVLERISGIYKGKIEKYHKLLIIKQNHYGEIPERIKEVCKDSPCGRMRLALSYFR